MTEAREELGVSYVTVDGIEGQVARIELADGTTEDWRLASLPKGVQEGDVVRLTVEGSDMDIEVDHAEIHRRRNRAQADLLALNASAPEGDLNL